MKQEKIKLKKAESLGVKVISEAEFMEMIGTSSEAKPQETADTETIVEPTLF